MTGQQKFFSRSQMPTVVWMVLTVIGVSLSLYAPKAPASARLVWNTSARAPAGLYVIDHREWRVGERVAIGMSEELATTLDQDGILQRGRLLIKRAAAGEGDRVCREGLAISINGEWVVSAKSTTSAGKPLPTWQGCRTLSPDDVFLLGDTPNSYDGRYFGVTDGADIVGVVSLVISFPATAGAELASTL